MQIFYRINNNKILNFFVVAGVSFSTIIRCVSQSQGDAMKQDINQLEYSVNQLREKLNTQLNQTERNTRSTLSSQSELQNFQRQLGENLGDIDALKLRVKKIEEVNSATTEQYAEQVRKNEQSITKLEQQVARLELTVASLSESIKGSAPKKTTPPATPPSKAPTPSPSKAPASGDKAQNTPLGAKTSADLLNVFKKEYEKGHFQELVQKTSSIIEQKQFGADMRALALEFRGEAKFRLNDYRGSALDLANYVEQYPTADRVSHALLLLGDSYVYLKKQDVASSYYHDCAKRYPDTSEGSACLARVEKIGGK